MVTHSCLWIPVAAEKDFVGASLVSVLHKLLSDERSAPEIKYNSMILICAVMGSGETYICLNRFKITLVIFYRAVNPIPDSDVPLLLVFRASPQRSPEPGVHWRGVQAEGSRKQNGVTPGVAHRAAINCPELNDCVQPHPLPPPPKCLPWPPNHLMTPHDCSPVPHRHVPRYHVALTASQTYVMSLPPTVCPAHIHLG